MEREEERKEGGKRDVGRKVGRGRRKVGMIEVGRKKERTKEREKERKRKRKKERKEGKGEEGRRNVCKEP